MNCVRRHLAGVEDVREVERDPEVRRPRLPDREQGRAHVRHEGVAARLVRLVFEGDVDGWIVAGDLVESRDGVVPHPPVVGLEGIVEAVLAEPERHQRAAHLGERVDAAPGEVDGLAPPFRVGIGERAEPEISIRVVAHGEAVQPDTEPVEHAGELSWTGVLEVIRVVEIGGVESPHRRRALQQVRRRHPVLAGPVGLGADLEGVQPGGVAGRLNVAHSLVLGGRRAFARSRVRGGRRSRCRRGASGRCAGGGAPSRPA